MGKIRPGLLKQRKRLRRLEEELCDRQTKLDNLSHRHWQEFVSLMDILEYFGCLEQTRPTGLGESAAAIRGDNELWLGLALASDEFDGLEPQHLAAACAALVTENSRPDSWTRYRISAPVETSLEGIRGIRRQILQLQRRYEVMLPVLLEYDLIGLVEQWALETEWQELCNNTSLDEGDIVRILRRTLDFLSQIPHVPYLSNQLKDNARRATQLINRFPVNENIR